MEVCLGLWHLLEQAFSGVGVVQFLSFFWWEPTTTAAAQTHQKNSEAANLHSDWKETMRGRYYQLSPILVCGLLVMGPFRNPKMGWSIVKPRGSLAGLSEEIFLQSYIIGPKHSSVMRRMQLLST